MGMGSYAVSSFVIGYDDLKKICPDEISTIENERYFKDIGWGNFGRWLAWDDPTYIEDAIIDASDNDDLEVSEKLAEDMIIKYDKHIQALTTSFHEKTGLTLYFDNYDEDGGDRYDEPNDKDGCIFCVDGMMVLSPAGEKYKDIISQRRWTQFG